LLLCTIPVLCFVFSSCCFAPFLSCTLCSGLAALHHSCPALCVQVLLLCTIPVLCFVFSSCCFAPFLSWCYFQMLLVRTCWHLRPWKQRLKTKWSHGCLGWKNRHGGRSARATKANIIMMWWLSMGWWMISIELYWMTFLRKMILLWHLFNYEKNDELTFYRLIKNDSLNDELNFHIKMNIEWYWHSIKRWTDVC